MRSWTVCIGLFIWMLVAVVCVGCSKKSEVQPAKMPLDRCEYNGIFIKDVPLGKPVVISGYEIDLDGSGGAWLCVDMRVYAGYTGVRAVRSLEGWEVVVPKDCKRKWVLGKREGFSSLRYEPVIKLTFED